MWSKRLLFYSSDLVTWFWAKWIDSFIFKQESVFQTSSPNSRRESTPLLDKVKVDVSLINKAKAAIALEKGEEKKRKAKKATDQLPVLKYLNNQVSTAFIFLYSLIIYFTIFQSFPPAVIKTVLFSWHWVVNTHE